MTLDQMLLDLNTRIGSNLEVSNANMTYNVEIETVAMDYSYEI